MNPYHDKMRMPTILTLRNLIAVLFLALLSTSCANKDLSREKAAELIIASKEAQSLKTKIKITNSAPAQGLAQGLWDDNVRNQQLVLREPLEGVATISRTAIELTSPANVNVDITGIAAIPGADTLKEAQFSWSYSSMPGIAKRFAINGGSGQAVFRLFDDGWRLERIKIQHSDEGMTMTSAETNEVNAAIMKESARLSDLAEKARIEQARRASIISASKTPSETLGTYEYNPLVDIGFRLVTTQGKIVLTDVGFSISGEQVRNTGRPPAIPSSYLFFDGLKTSEMSIRSLVYKSVTWGTIANVVTIDPFMPRDYASPLNFSSKEEANRFAFDLERAVSKWKEKYPEAHSLSKLRK